MLVLRATFLLAAAAVVLVATGAAAVSPDKPTGEIVFTRSTGQLGRSDLYAAAADGSRARLVLTDAAQAAVSPDGSRILFVRGGAVWVTARNGSGQRRLTKPVPAPVQNGQLPPISDSGPAWSPNGRTVYFSRTVMADETTALFRIGSDGTGLRRLTTATRTSHGHCQADPSPLPVGRIIAFAESYDCAHGSDSTIVAVTDAGRAAKLPFRFPDAAETIEFDPAVARDGTFIAYAVLDMPAYMMRIGRSGIYVSSSDGSPPVRVAPAMQAREPAWSPDGNWIAYTRTVFGANDAQHDIWLVRSDGTGSRRVAATRFAETDPAWLPPAR